MYRKLCLLTALLALLVITVGAYVRLSHAGLGCPDWPGCYGKLQITENNLLDIQAGKTFSENPPDIVSAGKEMTHRYLAGLLAIMTLIMAPLAWKQRRQFPKAFSLSLIVLATVVLQAVMGMWVVNFKVMPIIVTIHMLLGFTTFWLLGWTYLYLNPDVKYEPIKGSISGLTIIAIVVLLIQIFLGGWVSSNYAALACSDFPRCNGAWLPEADFSEALAFFKGLLSENSSVLSANAAVAAHWLHRLTALLCFIVLSVVMLSATAEQQPKPIRRAGILLSLLLLIQIALGIFSVKLSLPLWMAVAHNLFAALLMLPLLEIYFFSRFRVRSELQVQTGLPVEVDISAPTSEVGLEPEVKLEPESLFLRLKTQLKKTRGSLAGVLSSLSFGQKPTGELLEEIETNLLMADIGIETTSEIIRHLSEILDKEQLKDPESITQALKQNLYDLLQPCSQPLFIPTQDTPFVILVVGVNGAGKTTSIGKLAHRLQSQGYSVMLAAGDTFRAAAVEQLQTWGERNHVQVVAQHSGADSASVIFDALQSAKAKKIDVLIADTAGRLHTKSNLMDELKKIKRIMSKLDETAPHEVLLILDAGTGQNALSQARLFNEAVSLTGLAITKLDGTAKGGVIFALANQLKIPIRFIGVGEAKEDLQDFDAKNFVDALFAKD
jgi:fused signal recognition particle receptor